MPVSRVIAGTKRRSDGKFAHFTAGCHGTAGLLVSVLRAANVPAKCQHVGGHAAVLFLADDRALTHGDDPYNRLTVRAPTEELFVDLATFDRWLGPITGEDKNVGRQSLEVGIRWPAQELLDLHSQDVADRRSHASSRVAEAFTRTFTVEELEARRLWEHLDDRARELAGGVNAAPAGGPIDLEGESLPVLISGGHVEVQPMGEFAASTWSGAAQLWWVGASVKDQLTATIPVPDDGTWRVSARFTTAPDYGIFEITLDDAPTRAMRLDLWSRDVRATEFVPLGEFVLVRGEHRLGAMLVDVGAPATPRGMFGIDVVRIERVPETKTAQGNR